MAKRKSVSDKISNAIDFIKSEKYKQALNLLETLHTKMSEKEDTTTKVKRSPNKYNLFVKAQFKKIKESNPELNNTDIMIKIAKLWKSEKAS